MYEGETAADSARPVIELPRYKCHKVVHALKIKEIRQPDANSEACHQGGDIILVPEDEGYAPVTVGFVEFQLKHNPQPGGYYVVYEDGYKSYSPAKAFEDGYTRVS